MIGLVMLAGPILSTLLEYRAFNPEDTRMAAISLAAYSLGLPAFIGIKILAPGFYSRQDTRTPVKVGLIAMGVNLALNLLVVIPWIWFKWPAGHAVLALSTAIAAHVNAQLLYHHLRDNQTYHPLPGWSKLALQILLALLAMAAVLWWLTPALNVWQHWPAYRRGLTLLLLIAAAAAAYLLTLRLTGLRFREILRSHD
jgi:putative peptidoglycan lipid II flippase